MNHLSHISPRRSLPAILLALLCALVGAVQAHAHDQDAGHPLNVDVDGQRVRATAHNETVPRHLLAGVAAKQAKARIARNGSGQVRAAAAPMRGCGAEHLSTPENPREADTAHLVNPELPSFQVFYVFPADAPDRYQQFKDILQGNVSLIERFMASESGGKKTVRFLHGTECGPEQVSITAVRLSKPAAAYRHGDYAYAAPIEAELRSRGLVPYAADDDSAPPRNYLYLTDGINEKDVNAQGFGRFGQSEAGDAEDPDPTTNIANHGGWLALVNAPRSFDPAPGQTSWMPALFLHEIGHTLGAVQPGAPHTSGMLDYWSGGTHYRIPAAHCTDGWDVMCYRDGGDRTNGLIDGYGRPLRGAACESLGVDELMEFDRPFDCGRDDYFNPDGPVTATSGPRAGQRIWNTYDSRFLCAIAERGSARPCRDEATAARGDTKTWKRRVSSRLTGRLRGRARAHLVLNTTGGRIALARLSGTGRLRLPAGEWQMQACLRSSQGATSDRSRCQTRRVRVRRGRRQISLPSVSLRVERQRRASRVKGTIKLVRRGRGRPSRVQARTPHSRPSLTAPALEASAG